MCRKPSGSASRSPTAQVSDAMLNVARNIKLSPDKLNEVLAASGVNPDTLRDRLRAALAWQKVTESAIQPRVQISELELDQQAAGLVEESMSYDYVLKEILFVTSSGRSASGRTAEANQYRRSFSGCDRRGAALAELHRRRGGRHRPPPRDPVARGDRRRARRPQRRRHHQAARRRQRRLDARGLLQGLGPRPDLRQGPDPCGARRRARCRRKPRFTSENSATRQTSFTASPRLHCASASSRLALPQAARRLREAT